MTESDSREETEKDYYPKPTSKTNTTTLNPLTVAADKTARLDSVCAVTGVGGPGRPPCWRTLKESRNLTEGLGSVSLN